MQRLMMSLGFAAALASCAADTTAPDQLPAQTAEAPATEPSAFTLWLDRATTAETAIPAIVAAAHQQLAAACERTPGAAVRILNPLASGSYQDVCNAGTFGSSAVWLLACAAAF